MLRALTLLCATAGDPFPAAAPEEVGLSAAHLEAVNQAVADFVADDEVIGVELLVICGRHTVLHEVHGWKDRESRQPMGRNTIFNIRSMTKPLIGTGVQMLAAEDWFALEDPVAEHLELFTAEKSAAITIEQLLTHRSGLPWEDPGKPWEEYADLYEVVAYFAEQGPKFTPGSRFQYSDPGSDSLAVLLSEVSGEPVEALLHERLFAPLGMGQTFALTSEQTEREQEIASNYVGRKGEWERYWKPGDGCLLPFVKGSGTTWYSSPRDYARFLALWMDGGVHEGRRLLPEESVARALEPASRMTIQGAEYPCGFPQMEAHYGHHFEIFVARDDPARTGFGHNGSDGTYAWAFPELDLMVLYFTQSRGHETGHRFEELIDRNLLQPRLAAR